MQGFEPLNLREDGLLEFWVNPETRHKGSIKHEAWAMKPSRIKQEHWVHCIEVKSQMSLSAYIRKVSKLPYTGLKWADDIIDEARELCLGF